ncbi:hypothetical protein PsYK624_123310 [Phanerochaete sordida]|uniref:Uncharacterized protein n=1 Tax=Phanerochaete sordida TaxID=48140 RepID=A0A9P3GHM7_9APHY|nr:hypothetical protein PsYK624_123310 [Phanerochaete sordida]
MPPFSTRSPPIVPSHTMQIAARRTCTISTSRRLAAVTVVPCENDGRPGALSPECFRCGGACSVLPSRTGTRLVHPSRAASPRSPSTSFSRRSMGKQAIHRTTDRLGPRWRRNPSRNVTYCSSTARQKSHSERRSGGILPRERQRRDPQRTAGSRVRVVAQAPQKDYATARPPRRRCARARRACAPPRPSVPPSFFNDTPRRCSRTTLCQNESLRRKNARRQHTSRRACSRLCWTAAVAEISREDCRPLPSCGRPKSSSASGQSRRSRQVLNRATATFVRLGGGGTRKFERCAGGLVGSAWLSPHSHRCLRRCVGMSAGTHDLAETTYGVGTSPAAPPANSSTGTGPRGRRACSLVPSSSGSTH